MARRLCRSLGLALLVVGALGCGGEPPTPPETYTTRGIVRQVGMGTPGGDGEILIHHEAIAEFRDDRGEVVGMEAMAMPFAVAEPALAEGLEAGDRIGFTFEVRWEGGPPLRLTTLESLGDDTRLDFEIAPSDVPEAGGAGAEETPGAEVDPAEVEDAEGDPSTTAPTDAVDPANDAHAGH